MQANILVLFKIGLAGVANGGEDRRLDGLKISYLCHTLNSVQFILDENAFKHTNHVTGAIIFGEINKSKNVLPPADVFRGIEKNK